MKNYSVCIRLLTVKNKSCGFKDFPRTASGKGCQYREEDSENKITS